MHYGKFSVRSNTEALFANIIKIISKNFISLNFLICFSVLFFIYFSMEFSYQKLKHCGYDTFQSEYA